MFHNGNLFYLIGISDFAAFEYISKSLIKKGYIKVIDARQSNANAELAGNNNDNVIFAGTGETSLWGGFGGNDLLVGNSSKDSFYYGIGNGNDTIQNVSDGDNVILLDVSLDQIIDANITADAVTIKLNNGGSLQINGSADVTYQLADGSKYSANQQQLEWQTR